MKVKQELVHVTSSCGEDLKYLTLDKKGDVVMYDAKLTPVQSMLGEAVTAGIIV